MKSAVLEKPATRTVIKAVKFVCPAGYNLQLVKSSAGRFKEVDGHAIPEPFQHINFRKEGYLPPGVRQGHGFWRGIYITSDPDEIEFIRNHHFFRKDPETGLPSPLPEPRYENGQPVNESAGGTDRFIYEVPYDPQEKPQAGPKQVIRRGEKEVEPQPTAPIETSQETRKARIPKGLKRA